MSDQISLFILKYSQHSQSYEWLRNTAWSILKKQDRLEHCRHDSKQPLISSNISHPSNALASDTISLFGGGPLLSGKHGNLDILSEAAGQ